MKKIGVIGRFGETRANGQTIKTENVTDELIKTYGENEVMKISSGGGAKTIFKAPFQVVSSLKNCRNVLIFPAHNGVRVYAPLLVFFRRFYKGRKIFYSVVGGWLADMLEKKKRLAATLKKFDALYVETTGLKERLESTGFTNVKLMPNFKLIKPLGEDELVYPDSLPYRVCTFSRVMKQKGIEDAVNAVKAVNEKAGAVVCTLDIYGDVVAGEEEWFDTLKRDFPPYVRYKGAVDGNKSVGIIKNYFALLFPTRFYTEGIPGTIIDAYASGVPVISAAWQNVGDIVDDNVTGYVYGFGDANGLETRLGYAIENADEFLKMKGAALVKAKSFSPERIMPTLTLDLE